MNYSNTISLLSLIAKRYSIAFFVSYTSVLLAQTPGKVTVIKDPRIDTLIALRLSLSKLPNNNINTTVTPAANGNGYRVQFFTSPNRNDVYNAQSKFKELYPDLKTYIIYSEPNFKIRAGDFRTRLEATRLMEQLRPQFPTLFIIPEKINLKND